MPHRSQQRQHRPKISTIVLLPVQRLRPQQCRQRARAVRGVPQIADLAVQPGLDFRRYARRQQRFGTLQIAPALGQRCDLVP